MELQIQDLVNSIKKNGIAEADKKAAQIIAEAQAKADDLIANANKEAQKIAEETKKEVAVVTQSGKAAIEQASRDVTLSLKKSLTDQFERLLESSVTKTLTSKEIVNLIVQVVKLDLLKADETVVELKADEKTKLVDSLKVDLADELKKGLEIKVVAASDVGFKLVSKKDGSYFDFGSEEVTRLLKPFLNEALNEIIFAN